MQLVIDRGNSFWKIAIFEGDAIVFFEKHTIINISTFKNIFESFKITSSIISSVVTIENEILFYLGNNSILIELNKNTKLPIELNYKTPETLGKDRIAAAVGAFYDWPLYNCLIIDAGTCITYDILEKGGKYIGGSISPGLQMRFKALNNFTDKLPLIQFKEFDNLTGKTTEESILSGVLRGICFEVDGFIAEYSKEIDPLKIILTGGDAFFFDKNLKNSIFADSNLVLKGLKEILKYNV